MTGRWVVDQIKYTHYFYSKYSKKLIYNCAYHFWIMGHYRNEPDKHFGWALPFECLYDEQFDFTNAVMIP